MSLIVHEAENVFQKHLANFVQPASDIHERWFELSEVVAEFRAVHTGRHQNDLDLRIGLQDAPHECDQNVGLSETNPGKYW